MTTDVTIYEPLAVMPILDIQGAMVRRQAMVDFVRTILVEGVDFGTIPGTDKPTLLKPGAEKLTTFFGLSKRFEIMEKVEDWTGSAHGSEPFFYYLYRARLYRSEVLIAESDGSASSWESKYRYRWVGEFDVPAHLDKATLTKRGGKQSEPAFAIDKAETGGKYGKPAAYWKQYQDAIQNGTARRMTKTSAAGKTMDAWEIDSTVYRVPNPDPADVVNTIQKMAQKRALIAATLLAVNASEFFTQDMEDFVDAEYTMQAPTVAPVQPARTVTIERATAQPKPSAGPTWTPEPDATEASNGNGAKSAARPHWNSVDDAVMWGYDQGAFKAVQHAQNAYNKLRDEAKASDNPPKNAADMFKRWHADVLLRLERAKVGTITDAELDGTDMQPAEAGEGDEAPQF